MVKIEIAKQVALSLLEAASVVTDQLGFELGILRDVLDHQAVDH